MSRSRERSKKTERKNNRYKAERNFKKKLLNGDSKEAKVEKKDQRPMGKNRPHSRSERHEKKQGLQRETTQKNQEPSIVDRRKELKDRIQFIDGKIQIHPDGFGFLIPTDPKQEHLYISEDSLKHVMNGDIVRVRVEEIKGREDYYRRGQVFEILKHSQKEFLGLLRKHKNGAIVIPEMANDRKHTFQIQNLQDVQNIKNGASILCKIISHPTTRPGLVEVLHEVKDPKAPSNDTLRVLVEANWPRDFSRAALDEATHQAESWESRLEKIRKDYTALPFVTIDGKDARDFDDAVYAEKKGQDIRLYVAVADVSHFVKSGGALDQFALERATSAYFPDHVVPMLPEILSNGVCSLNPNEKRASMVCEMTVNNAGHIQDYDIKIGVIQSHRRMTYEEMQSFIEKEEWALNDLQKLQAPLENLVEVFERLLSAKTKRGAIDLDIPEAKIYLAEDGTIRDIQTRTRLASHRLIEECMLAANNCTAHFMTHHCQEGVYRIHEEPDSKKIEQLMTFLENAGLSEGTKLGPKKKKTKSQESEDSNYQMSPGQISDLLRQLSENLEKEDPRLKVIQTLVLRSMKQARYSTQRLGHFALSILDYTHFTSPIRRYPDLLVHRIIKNQLLKGPPLVHTQSLEALCKHSSDQERVAMDMERKLVDFKKCRYMSQHLGEEFEAWASGITEKGIFCQIEGHFVDGLINSQTLHERGRFRFQSELMAYQGAGSQWISLGTRLQIKVVAVDVDARKIDFDLIKILSTGNEKAWHS